MSIIKTLKQIEAIDLMSSYITTLLEGGTRSGKTFIIIYGQVVRALHYAESWHLAARLRLSHAKASLWYATIPQVLNAIGLVKGTHYEMNSSDLFIEFSNKSMLWLGGLDDKDRTEKILGNEYATVFLNEISQISYPTYEIVTTRVNPKKGVPARVWLDHNPGSISHWAYKMFHQRKFPDGRPVPKNDYAHLLINPKDNTENVSETLLERLQNLSGNKKIRFLDGGYQTDVGALWKRNWIKYEVAPINLIRVVVGVDPSGSKEGDEIGIIVAGIDEDGDIYILADYSMHGTPDEWSNEVLDAYDRYKADVICAEKNYGGEMVEAVITKSGRRSVNVKLVNATRGKIVRAEPISAMYQRGEVKHVKELTALEDELCTFKGEAGEKSPNRLDGLVWALTELAEEGGGLDYVG